MSNEDDSITMEKHDKPEGHEALITFLMRPLAGRLPLEKWCEYHTDCRFVPTSFKLRVVFQQKENNGPISCRVFLQRTDCIKRPVKLYVWMNCTISYKNVFRPGSFTCDRVWPDETIKGTVPNAIRSWDDVESLLNERVRLQYMICVQHCHTRNSLSSSCMNKEISGMLFAKL